MIKFKIKMNLGFILENKVQNLLKKLFGNEITGDSSITKIYGNLCYGIDHVSISDKIILIQDKWEEKKPSLSHIDHFIIACQHLQSNKDKICIFISKKPITNIIISIDVFS